MERIWLKVEGIQLCDFQRDTKKNAAWATVKMGEKSFVIRAYFFELEKDGRIMTQNNAMSRMRFFDVPILHEGKRKPALLLDEFLGKAIHDLYLHGEKGEELKAFL